MKRKIMIADKKKINFDAVEETLLIPLLMRWKDAKTSRPILGDRIAIDVANQIDFNWDKYGGWNKMSYYGCLVRAGYCDSEAVRIALEHSSESILLVNAGCGLDTRWHRTLSSLSNYQRVDLDLKEVMDIRKEVVPPLNGVTSVTSDLTSPDFIEQLKEMTTPNTHIVLVIEGVLMYFTDAEIRKLLERLYAAFGDRVTLVGDLLNNTIVKHQRKHDTLRHSQAVFKSGYDNVVEVEALHPRLKVLCRRSVLDMMKPHIFIARLLVLIPSMRWNTTVYTLGFQSL
ncbi:class I SAM-dependent methyltransferase [uncultured Porphyromonas sp.]|uniref:class I SAM-dependent methyltransferase n=1 Tax=uncultured Porphyromonas sp. TaxID=159274 RepID=UPI002621A2E9|nr:class I SAM-dependent methyltransferase [uncultured Porphyromonas sp.]